MLKEPLRRSSGNPVIAKGHSSHPRTTQLLVQECFAAAQETGMPKAMIQLVYRTSHEVSAQQLIIVHYL